MKNNKVIAMIVTILSLTMIFSGCGSKKEDTQNTLGESDSNEKILSIASGGELNNLSTIIMDSNNACAQKLVYECLVAYEEGEFHPCLAKSWEWSEDKTAITFHLREGVKFHDGESFNAEAVKKILDFYKANPNNAFLKGISTITNIDIVDDNTVCINYQAPYFAILNDLSSPDVAAMISPKTIEPDNFTQLKGFVGTGPYRYSEFVKGEYTEFDYYRDYWGEKTYYDKVIAKYIPDSASRLKALQTGEIDLIFGSAMLTYDDYKQASTLKNAKGKIADKDERTRNIVVNASGEMCSDINVRKAIAISIDKKGISDGLTYSYENVADRLFPKGVKHADCTMNNKWEYNPAEAEKLLDTAGWTMNSKTGIREKNGKPLKLSFTYQVEVAINKDIATTIKSQLANIGIDVELNGLEQMLWWQTDMKGDFDLTIWNTNATATVPQTYFTPWLNCSAGMAASSRLPEKADIDKAINEYLQATDDKRIDEIFNYLINFSNDNVIDIPLTYTKESIVYNSSKIADYDFYGYSEFFDISKLRPIE